MPLKEYLLIKNLASGYRRNPAQLNSLFGSDSELVQLKECGESVIALTTDGIIEEIRQGLYSDPFLVGWMTVMANLSDLAAVGARPEGVLIQLNLPPDAGEALLAGLQEGIEAACLACDTYVLGGDVNSSDQLCTSGTAFGVVPAGRVISRRGCQVGDLLYTTASAGQGTAFAFEQVFSEQGSKIVYRPVARLREGQLIREFASACLDTSDSLIPGLAQLAFVNETGFEVSAPYSKILHPDAQELAAKAGLPPWMMIAGPHGDFELLFTLPPEHETEFLEAAWGIQWKPLLLGTVVPEGLYIDPGSGALVRTEAWQVANLFSEVAGNPHTYLESLLSFHQTLIQ